MPKTRYEIDRSAKVTALLDTAEHLFNERGYAGTTTAALAEAAGIAQNAVYWYFPSKDHLFVAVLDRMLDRLVDDLKRVERRRLVDQIVFAAERLRETEELGAAVADRARTSSVIAEFGIRMQATLRQILRDAVQRAAPSVDADLVTDAILVLARGTHDMSRAPRRRLLSFAVERLTADAVVSPAH